MRAVPASVKKLSSSLRLFRLLKPFRSEFQSCLHRYIRCIESPAFRPKRAHIRALCNSMYSIESIKPESSLSVAIQMIPNKC